MAKEEIIPTHTHQPKTQKREGLASDSLNRLNKDMPVRGQRSTQVSVFSLFLICKKETKYQGLAGDHTGRDTPEQLLGTAEVHSQEETSSLTKSHTLVRCETKGIRQKRWWRLRATPGYAAGIG